MTQRPTSPGHDLTGPIDFAAQAVALLIGLGTAVGIGWLVVYGGRRALA